MIFDLSGKVAVVTGGYGHLGSGIAEALRGFNCMVVIAGRSREKFNSKFENRDGFEFVPCDILDSKSFDEVFQTVHERHNRIDILVNNAASIKGRDPLNISDEDWSYSMEAVVSSVQKSIKSVTPYMKSAGGGKIINISSMYGVVSPKFDLYAGEENKKFLNPPHYGAGKAAMIQLTKYYAAYLGLSGINVNAISPGPFPKEIIQNENPEFKRRLSERNALGRIGKPEDLAGAVVLLSSSASDFITGQNLIVDGGWTIW